MAIIPLFMVVLFLCSWFYFSRCSLTEQEMNLLLWENSISTFNVQKVDNLAQFYLYSLLEMNLFICVCVFLIYSFFFHSLGCLLHARHCPRCCLQQKKLHTHKNLWHPRSFISVKEVCKQRSVHSQRERRCFPFAFFTGSVPGVPFYLPCSEEVTFEGSPDEGEQGAYAAGQVKGFPDRKMQQVQGPETGAWFREQRRSAWLELRARGAQQARVIYTPKIRARLS